MHITEKSVAKLKPAAKRQQFFDDVTVGFGVRVDADNRKSFFWLRKIQGKQVFRALCGRDYPFASVDAARTEAEEWNGKAATWKQAGYPEPSPFDKPKKAAPSNVPTFRELVESFITNEIRPNSRNPRKAEMDTRWKSQRFFSTWLDLPMNKITSEHVLEMKRGCGTRRVTANRAVALAKRLYNWAGERPDGKLNFFACDNPAKDILEYDEKPRERFIQPDELPRFFAALENEPHTDLRHFVSLLLQTGARRSDVFSMKWEDIKWEREVWTIPAPKNGISYDVALLPAALEILKARRKMAAMGVAYVFPGIGGTGHLIDLRIPWCSFRERCGLLDITFHDLRRTNGSYQALAGVPLQQIGKNLGHVGIGSTGIYARLHTEALRTARQSGEKTMRQLMMKANKRLSA